MYKLMRYRKINSRSVRECIADCASVIGPDPFERSRYSAGRVGGYIALWFVQPTSVTAIDEAAVPLSVVGDELSMEVAA